MQGVDTPWTQVGRHWGSARSESLGEASPQPDASGRAEGASNTRLRLDPGPTAREPEGVTGPTTLLCEPAAPVTRFTAERT